ncbi:probable 39S ribosomal protein L24, mitochondrial isoform X3 [Lingula anatina]|uniref:Large ribosomal subunit protein uL24m n=1 Tax=Lingula anatina TaxID=7574 RepID=A0A1S3J9B5_LINAN|nr:probable 39S ribosomal protein L24, mitochondrial isoform X3 [Lingula anatina]|eukprot:XP_013406811.1 probable 39S ribosomal protein L24, mitochondrial isoform X3 [Lingula anatina]
MKLTQQLMCSYWKRYVDRHFILTWRWKGQLKGQEPVVLKRWHLGKDRPWTTNSRLQQLDVPPQEGEVVMRRKNFVEPLEKWPIFKGDQVYVLEGKDAGKIGIVNSVWPERNWVFVEGLNCKFVENQLSDDASDPPELTREEQPLLVTEHVKLVDPSDMQPTDFEWRYDEEGNEVRVSSRSGRVIPLPSGAQQLEDFVIPSQYAESPDKDTKNSDLMKITYKPSLKYFEEELMENMGIEEKRKRAKTYWY